MKIIYLNEGVKQFNKFTNELFTGSVEFKYKNGKIRSRGSFKMGTKQ